jgi:hypothetical protein
MINNSSKSILSLYFLYTSPYKQYILVSCKHTSGQLVIMVVAIIIHLNDVFDQYTDIAAIQNPSNLAK